MSDGAGLAVGGEPTWRVRVARSPGLRRWTDRRLAQAQVRTPSGQVYFVRVKRNWPIARSPLGPVDSLVPNQVSLAAILAANMVVRGRTGWTIEVVSPPTAWRSDRVLHARRSRDRQRVVDLTMSIIAAIFDGRDPADLDDELPTRDLLRRTFHWE